MYTTIMKTTSRELSLQHLSERWQLHSGCEAQVRYSGPHWGVYCREHGTWIQWIRRDQLEQLGIEPEPRVRARDLFK